MGAVGAGIVAVVSVALGGTAVFGGVVYAVLSDGEEGCLSALRSTRDELIAADTRGIRRANRVFDRAQGACRDGRLGLWTGIRLSIEIRSRAEDGRLSPDDLEQLDRELARLSAGR